MKRRATFLPFSPPSIGEEEIAEVVDTLRSGWLTTGPKAKRFESEFAHFLGAEAALALNSCTAALHLALMVLDVKRGDTVITTPMTFCSGVNVIEHVGARPILVDIEPETLTIDPDKLEAALQTVGAGHRIKAVLPVHYAGHPCDMVRIMDLAKRYEIHVIEDAAHALPARVGGRLVGTIGDLTAFSFYATKNLTTGEGGMLIGSPERIEKARVLSLHGMTSDAWERYRPDGSWMYQVRSAGFKYNMPDIQASIGIHQLGKLPEFQMRRRQIVGRYQDFFSKKEEVEVPTERDAVEHAWHLYVLRLNLDCFTSQRTDCDSIRSRFIQEMKDRNIGCSVHFIPIHLHPYYRIKYGFKPDDYPVAFHEYQRIISLPLYPAMTDDDVEDVLETTADVIAQLKR